MSTSSYTGADVMDKSASLLNDTAKSLFTYVVQTPYLNMALDDLKTRFELNNIPVTNVSSAVIDVDAGDTEIQPDGGVAPTYPANLVEIQRLWCRSQSSNDPFIPMNRREFLMQTLANQPQPYLTDWTWQEQVIKFFAATLDLEVKIDYIRDMFIVDVDNDDIIGIIGAKPYLYYRTAALCSRFIGENPTRADALDLMADNAINEVIGIGTKGRQETYARRRPFLAAYKSRGYVT